MDRMERIMAAKANHMWVEGDAANCQTKVGRQNSLDRLLSHSLVLDANSFRSNKPIPPQSSNNRGNKFTKRELFAIAKTPQQDYIREERLNPSCNILALRNEFEKFALAMEKSAKSQQDIHKWDRMMGLKRSHSKTMRLSMRSRSKLKEIFLTRSREMGKNKRW
ncbi:unnamed protein product [Pseudo-nitzschia multistriata]|uniref:Uncharacterized protein n=1 Tax=Pseudo-nitzschia multistriata TaxID=183589 RepID=A0A448YYN9_9STRA|nr:unnamed protein product [Pseudo-nitzschia multistriata]